MIQSKILPSPDDEEYIDENGFNVESIKFAQYFYLNNQEIKKIKNKYLFMRKHSINNAINEESFRLWVVTPQIPLLTILFGIYKKKPMSWNNFFQLVIFCCLCPMVAFFNFVLHLTPEYNGKINMYVLKKFFSLVGKKADNDELKESFHRLDIDKDGSLKFHQFITILSHNYNYCKKFYSFRMDLIKYFFPDDRYKIILNRRRNIHNIKEYMMNNNDTLSPQPCSIAIQQLYNGDTHPDKFDYDCELEELSFNTLTLIIIQKYGSMHKAKKTGNIHYLEFFKENKVIHEIDQFYISYIKTINNIMKAKMPLHCTPFMSNSELSIDFSNNGGNTNRTSVSILRSSTYSNMTRTSTAIAATPISTSKFKHIKKSIHKLENELTPTNSVDA